MLSHLLVYALGMATIPLVRWGWPKLKAKLDKWSMPPVG